VCCGRRTRKAPLEGSQWLLPRVLARWEVEIGKTEAPGQPRQVVCKTPTPKITRAKWTGGVAQVVEHLLCPEFKL
jgi:hypothetical protein